MKRPRRRPALGFPHVGHDCIVPIFGFGTAQPCPTRIERLIEHARAAVSECNGRGEKSPPRLSSYRARLCRADLWVVRGAPVPYTYCEAYYTHTRGSVCINATRGEEP